MDYTYATTVDYHSKGCCHSSGCMGGSDDLAQARANLSRDVNFYLAMPDDVFVTLAAIDRLCKLCWGQGKVNKARNRGVKLCPSCRGKDSSMRIEIWMQQVIPQGWKDKVE